MVKTMLEQGGLVAGAYRCSCVSGCGVPPPTVSIAFTLFSVTSHESDDLACPFSDAARMGLGVGRGGDRA